MTQASEFDRLFQALSDPYRRGFVEYLSLGPASATELADRVDVQLPAVLKHLQVLEASGLVASEKRGRVRTYRVRSEALLDVGDWIEQRHHDLNAAFDRLADLMSETAEEKDH